MADNDWWATAVLDTVPAPAAQPSPAAASGRGYLRRGLPAIYQEGDFGMRFLQALEVVLDPVVGLLDNLPRHLDPGLAPADVLALVSSWLGINHLETRPLSEQREFVREAAEVAARRGTVSGLELALRLAFPGVPLRVEDGGGVRYGSGLDGLESLHDPGEPAFVVYCDAPVATEKQREISQFIASQKPAHVRFKLRVKTKRSGGDV